ncbi:Na+/H+ antiporter NhaC family protein [Thalassotalea euphylliae]|uniref:Na+/H+ antiporter NhaC family protein n=1 Tax=Thalassotalea euphylliae TaxID=1655234 RepID=A0A3E0TZT9_9GAMM|nr:Na+/H+ antiporter NhaC family protein [Thalassotalea euphylliae]REL29893.1 Na+/H+ antiporter NhaC family protein [Thalassotalea euphylliae]
MTEQTSPPRLLSLLPFGVFLSLFIGTGIVLTLQGVEFAFYQLPASVAIIPAIIVAIMMGKETISEQVNQFIEGAGHSNIITMGVIYLLAGAFGMVAKATGSVDASVQLGLALFPDYLIIPGLFIVAAFLSTAMGTSVGTIAAIAPIAAGFIEAASLSPALVAGSIISGAIFGDNLSIISDTTIASTRTQGARMKDKFRVNFKFALPAALISLVLFAFLGGSADYQSEQAIDVIGLLPYVVILGLALSGVNVFVVLLVGILLAAATGFVSNGYQLSALASDINKGFANVQDVFILALFIGGLSELVRRQGGLQALTVSLKKLAGKLSPNNPKRAAGLGIASLAFSANFFTANNTVSIIITGETAKELAEDGNIKAAESASLLDIFACINQGLLPYGAQALLLGATIGISPVDVVVYSFYPMILFFAALIAFWRITKN